MRCTGASGEGPMPHLERVRKGLITRCGAFGGVVEKRDVLDVEPVNGRIPSRGDLANELVLATLIAYRITDRNRKQFVIRLARVERVRAGGKDGGRVPSTAQPDRCVAFAVEPFGDRTREQLAKLDRRFLEWW